MSTPRNPADLLTLGRDPDLNRLLRACGADEVCITGGASDYDRFLALAAALPLCAGHPLKARAEVILKEATGLQASLCPHTAQIFWETWTDKHWYGRDFTPSPLPAPCPLCAPATPRSLPADALTPLPDPIAVKAPDPAAWSQALEAVLPESGRTAVLSLPDDYVFTRPNPYHAGLAVRRVADGEALTKQERDLLTTQALRVWGLAILRVPSEAPITIPPLILGNGSPEAVTALLAYLDASKALPPMVWVPHDSADAAAVSGLYATVRTGYAVTTTDSPELADEKMRAYAAAAPIGRAMVVEM